MRKLILILMTTLLIACQQTIPSESEVKDTVVNKGVYTDEIYRIKDFSGIKDNSDYLIAVSRKTFDDSTHKYSVHANISQNRDNHYSFTRVSFPEEDLPYIFEFLDRCENYKADDRKDVDVAIRYTLSSRDAGLAYKGGKVLYVESKDDGVFVIKQSLSDIRNQFAGAKQRLEQLKKEDEQTKRKSK